MDVTGLWQCIKMVGVEDRDADFEVAKGKSELSITWLHEIYASGGFGDIREATS